MPNGLRYLRFAVVTRPFLPCVPTRQLHARVSLRSRCASCACKASPIFAPASVQLITFALLAIMIVLIVVWYFFHRFSKSRLTGRVMSGRREGRDIQTHHQPTLINLRYGLRWRLLPPLLVPLQHVVRRRVSGMFKQLRQDRWQAFIKYRNGLRLVFLDCRHSNDDATSPAVNINGLRTLIAYNFFIWHKSFLSR